MSISRLQQPLGVAPDEVSFVNMYNLSPLLILAILFGIVVLATMSIRLRRARAATKRPVELEFSERVQFKRNMVEPLSCVRRTMENVSKTISLIEQKITAATPSQANLMPLGSPTKASCTDDEKKLAEVTVKLLKLSQRLRAAAQTFERNNTVPLLTTVENADSTAQTRRYLPFFLGNELFAISTRNVKTVIEANRLIIESNRPWRTRRAINLYGSVVPVIDLSTHFGGEPTQVNQSTLIVILVLIHDEHPHMIGVKVDALCKILNVAPSSIEPPLVQQADIRSSFTIGTVRAHNRSITVLDISRGLSMGIFPKSNSASRVLE
jgi:purine-binding chemotaxis protein CheW